MKKILFSILTFFLSTTSIYSQCEINPFIQNNYDLDVKLLALRDILNDPIDPDFYNPYIPEERFNPYLEKLSAIYDNPNNNPEITALFNDFQIHVNQEYNYPIELNTIAFSVNTNVSWVEDFKNTGVSGNSDLDQLILEFQFILDNFWDLNGITIFFIKTEIEFLNLNAIIGDFENIQDLNYAEIYYDIIGLRFNYTGIPYQINGENVAVADIVIYGNVFTFSLYAGDCFAGCFYEISWSVEVTDDCDVTLLTIPKNKSLLFSIYPNPVSENLYINQLNTEDYTLKIYSFQGKVINIIQNSPKSINVSELNTGIYFIELKTINGNRQIQKFIKK